MDNAILKKRLNTYRTSKTGQLRAVAEDVVIEVLRAWEGWTGTSKALCQSLGIKSHQLVCMIKMAKNLIKQGVVIESEFKEILTESRGELPSPCHGIEITWEAGRVIRFQRVDELLDFMKKAAA